MPSLVSHSKRFVFVHIPKSGGTSIVEVLGPFEDRARLKWLWRRAFPRLLSPRRRSAFRLRFQLAHTSAVDIRRKVEDYDSLLSFGFVRNPWDRHVSMYEYIRQTPSHAMHADVEVRSFEGYLRSLAERPLGRQAAWLSDETGRLIVDRVGRFETLAEDFAHICDDLGIAFELPHLNQSRREEYRDYYSVRTRDLVAQIDRRDIELFGYSF